jgi:hypothetical protein
MTEIESPEQPSDDQIRERYEALQTTMGAFLVAMDEAGQVGIDVSAAMGQLMRASFGADFDSLPPAVRMMIG